MAFHILANFLLSYQSFSYYFVEFFLYYNFNIQVECIYCECLLLYGSPFQFHGGVVLYILILLCIITFFFHYECFFGLFRKSLPTLRSQRYFLLFSSKHSLSTLSYLEMGNWFFKIWCEVGVQINSLPYCYPADWASFIEKTISPFALHCPLACDKSGNCIRRVFCTCKWCFLVSSYICTCL